MSTAGTLIWEKDFCIPSKTEAGHAVLDGVLLQLQDFEWEQKDVFAIQLSFEEALVNAIRHGNQSDNRLGVQVHLKITPDRFLATIQDEGPGFDPEDLPDPTLEDFLERPCGRGVKLMRAFMTSVHFNPKGNVVTLEKLRTSPVPEKFQPNPEACQTAPSETETEPEACQTAPSETETETEPEACQTAPSETETEPETCQSAPSETEPEANPSDSAVSACLHEADDCDDHSAL